MDEAILKINNPLSTFEDIVADPVVIRLYRPQNAYVQNISNLIQTSLSLRIFKIMLLRKKNCMKNFRHLLIMTILLKSILEN